jgi:hypothetical protein
LIPAEIRRNDALRVSLQGSDNQVTKVKPLS